MPYIKKLILAPIFLIFLSLLLYLLNPLLKLSSNIFSINFDQLIALSIFSLLLLLTGIYFVIFASLANDWKYILGVVIFAAILPIIFIPSPLSFLISLGIAAVLLITYSVLENKLKTYLNFSPTQLFTSSIKHTCTFLLLIFALAFYFSANLDLQKNGFQIPDQLIETSLKFANPTQNPDMQTPQIELPQIPKEQLEMLKQNPDLLRQSGLDPKILDTLYNPPPAPKPGNPPQSLLKQLVKEQLEEVIKPYLTYLPVILAILFYFSLSFILSILFLIVSPILWLTFYILEKTNFIKFTTETREVRKMVI